MTATPAFPSDRIRAEAILDARTAALAARRDAASGPAVGALATLVVLAGGRRFALPFAMLALTLAGRRLHALPVRDKAVIGAVHARGDLWIVYDLASLAGLAGGRPDGSRPEGGRILLLDHPGHRAALAVDAVEGRRLIETVELCAIGQEAAGAGALLRRATPEGVMILESSELLARLDLAGRKAP